MNSELLDLIESLSTSDPDKLTKVDIDRIRWFIRSDGCTGVLDIYTDECVKHDFYFRTHHDFSGKLIRFSTGNKLFFKGLARYNLLVAIVRYIGVTLFGKRYWDSKSIFHGEAA